MRKSWYISLLLCSLGLAACSSDALRPSSKEVNVQFNVVVAPHTKAEPVDTFVFDSKGAFGFWAMSLPGQKTWLANAQEAKMVADNAKAFYDKGLRWSPAETFLWKDASQRMNFFAYWPYTDRVSVDAVQGIRFENYRLSEYDELLYTEPIEDQDLIQKNGVVNVVFHRALSSVSFRLSNLIPENTVVVVRSITLGPLALGGSFSSCPRPQWQADAGTTGDLRYFAGERRVTAVEQIGERLNVIPQAFEGKVTLVCDIESGKTVLPEQTFEAKAEMNWEAGKSYEYNLRITGDLRCELKKL